MDKRLDADEFLGKYLQKVRHRYRRTTGEGCADIGFSHECVAAESLKNAVVAWKRYVVPCGSVPPLLKCVVVVVSERFAEASRTELTAHKQSSPVQA